MSTSGRKVCLSLLLTSLVPLAESDVPQPVATGTELKKLSLEELSQIEVISPLPNC
jgi:hypothetical protein